MKKIRNYSILYLCFFFGLFFFSDALTESVNTRLAGSLLKARHTDFLDNSILNGFARAPLMYQDEDWTIFENYKFNERAYLESLDIPFTVRFMHYKSAIRIQFYMLSVIEDVLYNVTGEAKNRVKIYKFLFALINALILFFFVLWIYREFGIPIAIFCSLLFCISPQVFEFDHLSVWWMNIMPFIFSLYVFRKYDTPKLLHMIGIMFLVFFSSLVSYEMMPTIMLSCLIPAFYYNFKNGFNKGLFIKQILYWAPLVFFGLLIGIVFHLYVLASFEGSWGLALDHFKNRFFVRTYELGSDVIPLNEAQKEGLETSLWTVIQGFLNRSQGLYAVAEYKYLMFCSILLLLARFYADKFQSFFGSYSSRVTALSIVILLAFVAAIARVVIFKSHGAQVGHQAYLAMSFNVPFKLLVIVLLSIVGTRFLHFFKTAPFHLD